jgi:hypothetical protein
MRFGVPFLIAALVAAFTAVSAALPGHGARLHASATDLSPLLEALK